MKKEVKKRMAKLDDAEETAKVLYYGDYGSGKTTALAKLTELGTVIYVDAEAGLKKKALERQGVKTERIITYEAKTYDDLDDLFWELKADSTKVAGVLIDSLTDFQKRVMEDILGKEVVKAEARGLDRDPFSAYEGDWGKGNEQMRRIIRRFRDLPVHVGFAALQRRDVDDDGKVLYGPALTPGVQSDAGGYVDVVCHLAMEIVPGWDEPIPVGTFRRQGKYQGKDRWGIMPKRMIDPSFDRVLGYIEGRITPETDEFRIRAKQAAAQDKEEQSEATEEDS